MSMAAILFNGAKPFEQMTISLRQYPLWNLMKIGQAVTEKKMFKDYTILYMYITQGHEQITLGIKFWLYLKWFATSVIQVSGISL